MRGSDLRRALSGLRARTLEAMSAACSARSAFEPAYTCTSKEGAKDATSFNQLSSTVKGHRIRKGPARPEPREHEEAPEQAAEAAAAAAAPAERRAPFFGDAFTLV